MSKADLKEKQKKNKALAVGPIIPKPLRSAKEILETAPSFYPAAIAAALKVALERGFEFHGLPCIDATEPIIIRVTDEDISIAVPNDPWNCAIAQAGKTLFKVQYVAVGKTSIYVISSCGTYFTRYAMTPSLRRAASNLDSGGRFDPGEYQLSAHCPAKLLGIYQGSKTRPAVPSGRRQALVKHFNAYTRATP